MTTPPAPAPDAPAPTDPAPTPPAPAAPAAPKPGPPAPVADTTDPATGTDPAEGQDDPDDRKAGGKEAANYRRRLRETEGERDALSARVERLHRADVDRLTAGRLAVAADLFDVGAVKLSEMLDESGDVDPGKVTEAVEGLLKARPGLATVALVRFPDLGQGRRGAVPTTDSSWAGALQNRKR